MNNNVGFLVLQILAYYSLFRLCKCQSIGGAVKSLFIIATFLCYVDLERDR